jgi:hypothetical protein
MADKYSGHCYCGAVAFEASGAPATMGYCHCDACRAYSGAPVNAFTLWKPDDVKVTRGGESVSKFESSPMSIRCYCTKCGGNVFIEHPTLGLIDIPAGLLTTFTFKPGIHLNYEDTVLPMKDGLPKLKDFPAEIGGSGATMAE